jgi:hypothetical protein
MIFLCRSHATRGCSQGKSTYLVCAPIVTGAWTWETKGYFPYLVIHVRVRHVRILSQLLCWSNCTGKRGSVRRSRKHATMFSNTFIPGHTPHTLEDYCYWHGRCLDTDYDSSAEKTPHHVGNAEISPSSESNSVDCGARVAFHGPYSRKESIAIPSQRHWGWEPRYLQSEASMLWCRSAPLSTSAVRRGFMSALTQAAPLGSDGNKPSIGDGADLSIWGLPNLI